MIFGLKLLITNFWGLRHTKTISFRKKKTLSYRSNSTPWLPPPIASILLIKSFIFCTTSSLRLNQLVKIVLDPPLISLSTTNNYISYIMISHCYWLNFALVISVWKLMKLNFIAQFCLKKIIWFYFWNKWTSYWEKPHFEIACQMHAKKQHFRPKT